MKILLTGAAGFLGKECVRQLRDAQHDIVTTDRVGDVDLLGDLADASFCRALPEADTVIHCAGVQYVSPDLPLFGRAKYFRRNNVEATRNLAGRYNGSATHFVIVGTSMMYHQSGAALYRPTSPMQAQGVYSASKLAAYAFVRALPNPTAAVLPCIIAGPGRGGLFRPFARSIRRSGRVLLPGRGDHAVHVVHVEDVASLIVRITGQRATGIYNAAGPRPLSIQQWVSEIAEEYAAQPVRRIRLPLAPIHWLSRLLGYRLLAREQLLMLKHPHVLGVEESLALGWQPKWDNANIIRETARALRSNELAVTSETPPQQRNLASHRE